MRSPHSSIQASSRRQPVGGRVAGKGCPGVYRDDPGEFAELASRHGFDDLRNAESRRFLINLP